MSPFCRQLSLNIFKVFAFYLAHFLIIIKYPLWATFLSAFPQIIRVAHVWINFQSKLFYVKNNKVYNA